MDEIRSCAIMVHRLSHVNVFPVNVNSQAVPAIPKIFLIEMFSLARGFCNQH